MTETEMNNEKTPFLLLYLYFGLICTFMGFLAISVHYGWIEPVEDSSLTTEEVIYVVALMSGVILSILLQREIRRMERLHPQIRRAIWVYLNIFLFACVIAVIDVCKDDEIDLGRIAGCVAFMIAIVGAYLYWMLHKNKDGISHADSFEKRMKDKDREYRTRRFREHEVLESRSDMGLANPGFAEQTWDGRRTYIHVKATVYVFCIIMGVITGLMIVGKHIDDMDVQLVCYTFAFVLGALILRGYIMSPLDYAVKHKAIKYAEGVRYALLLELSYATVVAVMNAVVFEAQKEIWGWDGYVVFFFTLSVLFVVTHLTVTITNKHNGHDFAFFDTDGYEKKKLDPRKEEEEKE